MSYDIVLFLVSLIPLILTLISFYAIASSGDEATVYIMVPIIGFITYSVTVYLLILLGNAK